MAKFLLCFLKDLEIVAWKKKELRATQDAPRAFLRLDLTRIFDSAVAKTAGKT